MRMLFGKLKRWMRGEVYIVVSEGFPALFLEACKAKNIRLRYLLLRSSGLEAQIEQKDLNEVLAVSASLGMHTEIPKMRGIPQFLLRYRKRYGIPVGILCAAAIISVLSSFVWSVDIEGTQQLDREAFASFLKDAGLSQGVFISSVDTGMLERQAEAFDPAIKKVTVNLVGCRAFVRVRERIMPPDIAEEGRTCELIAAKDGEIVKADITAGTPLIRVGDAVLKGDVLAQGAVPLKNGATRYVEASGIVIARTKIPVLCELSRKQSAAFVIRSRKKHSLILFGCEFPVRNNKSRPDVYAMDSVSYLKNGGVVFPIGIRTTNLFYCSERETELTSAKACLICADDLARRAAVKLQNCVVELQSETLTDDRQFSLEASFVVLENVAVQTPPEPIAP